MWRTILLLAAFPILYFSQDAQAHVFRLPCMENSTSCQADIRSQLKACGILSFNECKFDYCTVYSEYCNRSTSDLNATPVTCEKGFTPELDGKTLTFDFKRNIVKRGTTKAITRSISICRPEEDGLSRMWQACSATAWTDCFNSRKAELNKYGCDIKYGFCEETSSGGLFRGNNRDFSCHFLSSKCVDPGPPQRKVCPANFHLVASKGINEFCAQNPGSAKSDPNQTTLQ